MSLSLFVIVRIVKQNTEWFGFVSLQFETDPECMDPRDFCSREAKSADSVVRQFSSYIY